MSRRLGDDPLTRARKQAANAATASASVVPDSPGRRSSYNDVFFQRRSETSSPATASKPQHNLADGPERREISEVSEIPEIRELASASVVQANTAPEPGPAHTVDAHPAPVAVPLETIAPVGDAAAQSGDVPEKSQAAAPLAPDRSDAAPEPEKNGGFFKRLFGKFGK